FARKKGIAYLVMELPYYGEWLIPSAKAFDFSVHADAVPTTGLMGATVLFDLSLSEVELRRKMRSDIWKNIRKGLTNGLKVSQGGREDIDTFRKLMARICKRQGVEPTPPQPDFFHHLWDQFHGAGEVHLFLGSVDKEIAAAQIVFA